MDFLERLVGEEAESGVRHDAEDGGSESSVERLQSFLTRDTDEHVHDVTVPDHEQHHIRTHVISLDQLSEGLQDHLDKTKQALRYPKTEFNPLTILFSWKSLESGFIFLHCDF